MKERALFIENEMKCHGVECKLSARTTMKMAMASKTNIANLTKVVRGTTVEITLE